MPNEKLSIPDFAAKIKSSYPQYKDMPDDELTKNILAKYPQYNDMVNLNAGPPTPQYQWNPQDQSQPAVAQPLGNTTQQIPAASKPPVPEESAAAPTFEEDLQKINDFFDKNDDGGNVSYTSKLAVKATTGALSNINQGVNQMAKVPEITQKEGLQYGVAAGAAGAIQAGFGVASIAVPEVAGLNVAMEAAQPAVPDKLKAFAFSFTHELAKDNGGKLVIPLSGTKNIILDPKDPGQNAVMNLLDFIPQILLFRGAELGLSAADSKMLGDKIKNKEPLSTDEQDKVVDAVSKYTSNPDNVIPDETFNGMKDLSTEKKIKVAPLIDKYNDVKQKLDESHETLQEPLKEQADALKTKISDIQNDIPREDIQALAKKIRDYEAKDIDGELTLTKSEKKIQKQYPKELADEIKTPTKLISSDTSEANPVPDNTVTPDQIAEQRKLVPEDKLLDYDTVAQHTPEEIPAFMKSLNEPDTATTVRHGETADDDKKVISGNTDTPLSEKGVEQAKAKAEEVRDADTVVTSPIKRAEQTAEEIVKQTGADLEHNDNLKAWDVGDFKGMGDKEFAKAEKFFVKNPDATEFDGKKLGESFNTYLDRGKTAYTELRGREDNFAVVTHSKTNQILNALQENGGEWNDKAIKSYLAGKGKEGFELKKDLPAAADINHDIANTKESSFERSIRLTKEHAQANVEGQRMADVLINNVKPEYREFVNELNEWSLGKGKKPEITESQEKKNIFYLMKLIYSGWDMKDIESNLKQHVKSVNFYGKEKSVTPNEFISNLISAHPDTTIELNKFLDESQAITPATPKDTELTPEESFAYNQSFPGWKTKFPKGTFDDFEKARDGALDKMSGLSYSERSKLVADKLRALKSKPKFDAEGNKITLSAKGLTMDDVYEIAAKIIEGGGKIADAIDTGIKEIKKSEWYKDLKPVEKAEAVRDFTGEVNKQNVDTVFDKLKHDWLGDKDVANLRAKVENHNINEEIKASVGKGESWKDVSKAIQIYIDTKENPAHYKELYDKLSPGQKRIADLSQNLTDTQKGIADKVSASYEAERDKAVKAGILDEDAVKENYVNRTWSKAGKNATELGKSFSTTTKHSMRRTLGTILEGWAKGGILQSEGAGESLRIYKEELANVIENRELISEGSKTPYGSDGNNLFETHKAEGYEKVDNPGFKKWGFIGKVDLADKSGNGKSQLLGQNKETLISKDGSILEKQDIYAPKEVADRLNTILGKSKLSGLPGMEAVDKFNSGVKAAVVFASVTHALNFVRAHVLTGTFNSLGEVSPAVAMRKGLEAIYTLHPTLELLTHEGMTLGLIQDWNEHLLEKQTALGAKLDKYNVLPDVRKGIGDLWKTQNNFLFNKMGAGLKALDAINLFERELRKSPEKDPNETARAVASIMNDNYGGLNHKQMERNATGQHVMGLLGFAPDWTESITRLAVKAFTKGEQGDFARRMWTQTLLRGAAATAIANLSLALIPDPSQPDEKDKNPVEVAQARLKRAWDEGNLNFMKVNISPIAHYFGAPTDKDYYFSLFGHFSDPTRLATELVDPNQGFGTNFFGNKMSVLVRPIKEGALNSNWKGDRFTSLSELLGTDDKGQYSKFTTKKDKDGNVVDMHLPGEEKGGKLGGNLTAPVYGPHPVLTKSAAPSFMLYETQSMLPIGIQGLLQYAEVTQDGFTYLVNSVGTGVTSSKQKK